VRAEADDVAEMLVRVGAFCERRVDEQQRLGAGLGERAAGEQAGQQTAHLSLGHVLPRLRKSA
jgi:hypothetical protein